MRINVPTRSSSFAMLQFLFVVILFLSIIVNVASGRNTARNSQGGIFNHEQEESAYRNNRNSDGTIHTTQWLIEVDSSSRDMLATDAALRDLVLNHNSLVAGTRCASRRGAEILFIVDIQVHLDIMEAFTSEIPTVTVPATIQYTAPTVVDTLLLSTTSSLTDQDVCRVDKSTLLSGTSYLKGIHELEPLSPKEGEMIETRIFSLSANILVVGEPVEFWTLLQWRSLENYAVMTYNQVNALSGSICDEQRHVATSATARYVADDPSLPISTNREWIINVQLTGFCINCEDETGADNIILLNEKPVRLPDDTTVRSFGGGNGRNRMLLRHTNTQQEQENKLPYVGNDQLQQQQEQAEHLSSRNLNAISALQYATFCPVYAPKRLPTTSEYSIQLSTAVALTHEIPLSGVIAPNSIDPCCGYNTDGNTPVGQLTASELAAEIRKYSTNPKGSPYGNPINCWDMSQVTDLSYVFNGLTNFNEPLSCWDTSNVEIMVGTFRQAKSFNQDIANWDTKNVIKMQEMFREAESFNRNLSRWNVEKVESMTNMFRKAINFNQNLCAWADKTPNLEAAVYTFDDTSCENQSPRAVLDDGDFCYVCD